jgi:hypothetical protein
MIGADLVWSDDSYAGHRLEAAIAASKASILRVQMMKARAIAEPPTQIDLSVRFPYPGHRTCADWNAA